MPFTNTATKKRTLLAAAVEAEGYANESPSTAPTLQNLLETSEALKTTPEYSRSANRRSDRNRPGAFLSGSSTGGDIGIQLPFGHYDFMLEGLYYSAGFSTPATPVTATTISLQSIATSSTNYAKILDSGNGLGGLNLGETIELEGSGTAGGVNNVVCKVHSVAAGEVEVANVDFTDEAAGASITITEFASITNGITPSSYVLERVYTDQTGTPTGKVATFIGALMDGIELTWAPRQLVNGSFNVLGSVELDRTTTFGDGANIAQPQDISMNAVQHIGGIRVGGERLRIAQIVLRLANGNQGMEEVGRLGPFDYAEDDAVVTGEIQAYYTTGSASSAEEFQKSLVGQSSSLYIPMRDGAGNQYVFDTPTIKYTDSDRSPGDTSPGGLIVTLPFEAEITLAELMTTRLARRAAA